MDRVVFALKPVFVGWIAFVVQLPRQIFLTIWAALFCGGMISSFLAIKSFVPMIASGAVAFIAVPLFLYAGKRLAYSRTEYRFYIDRLEFEEGFFTINKKVIKFCDVKEVTLTKGVLQRTQGLGTVYLATLATGAGFSSRSAFGFGNAANSGVRVQDVRDPDDVYEKVRRLVDALGLPRRVGDSTPA